MVINLTRIKNEWLVTTTPSQAIINERFKTIELAAEFMVKQLNVDDDDIDNALYDMAVRQHNRALFADGKFSRSELA